MLFNSNCYCPSLQWKVLGGLLNEDRIQIVGSRIPAVIPFQGTYQTKMPLLKSNVLVKKIEMIRSTTNSLNCTSNLFQLMHLLAHKKIHS